jgi:dTDP-L-rhamnose 4-epimerase
MKVLVTGGAGFIGSWLIDALLDEGHEVLVIDNLSTQIHGAFPQPDAPWLRRASDVRFVRADVRDRDAMDPALAWCEVVVHLAAETGTGQSMYQIAHYYDVNQQATAALFEAIGTRHRHVRKVVLASSRSIYGEGAYRLGDRFITAAPRSASRMQQGQFEPTGPDGETLELVATPEDVTPMPASVYAATKLANETLGRIFSDAYGASVVALRFQNVYGERQSLRNPYTGILSIFSNRMRNDLPINIFEDGQESRDFVHVSDVVRAITLALEQSLEGFHTVNVGSGVPTSVLEVAELLRDLLNSRSELTVTGDFRAGDIRHCYADLTRARTVLGFQPLLSVKQGLRKFCEWVVTQPAIEDGSAKAMTELSQLGLGRTGK